ncbi:AAA family ATPase [Tsuneonella sp. HG222]
MNRSQPDGSRIVVVTSPEVLADLRTDGVAKLLPGLRLEERQFGEPIADAALANADLAVIEVNPDDGASVARISAIRERHRSLPVVAAIRGASVSLARLLVREGITDVVTLPFDLGELQQVCFDALASRQTGGATSTKLAPVISVARSIGGCGASSIASHLAADLAEHARTGRGAIAVDLDLQYGSLADYLGAHGRGSIADLLEARGRLDEELLRSIVADAGNGLLIVGAPEALMPLESVDNDDLQRVIHLLRCQSDYVVLDLPANLTNWTLATLHASDAVVLVVELSVASLRQAKRRIELFRSVGIEDKAIRIVVNRVEKRLFRTIDLDDVAQTLGLPVFASVALDAPTVGVAQNQGVRVSTLKGKSKFVSDIGAIGERLRASLAGKAA